MSAHPNRLSRLLAMVPYFLAHPGVTKKQAAADLGVTVDQLGKDLYQLWMCGLPGYSPGDLIDLDFEDRDTVDVTFSAGMDRPLRLTPAEASVLLMALRALLDMGGVVDADAAQRAIAKIERAVGDAALGADPTQTSDDAPTDPGASGPATGDGWDGVVRSALRNRRAVWLRYYSASRDATSERTVDPIRIQAVDGKAYLEGWCRESDGVRLFRLDRIDEARELEEPAGDHRAEAGSSSLSLFGDGDEGLPTVDLLIDPTVAWVVDYHLIDLLDTGSGDAGQGDAAGVLRGRMTYGSDEWLTRFLLGFGGRIRLADAPDVTQDAVRRATAALGAYEAAGTRTANPS
ncbi:helix-turn-helix transcriptional regulator [Williamsia deligens]|uniref:Helix-turn-helix transcriptional regulator n=1 Tax=Williamsia deligens TaxID=321325 RepID=A0ABW3GB39_9NOCA|nr:YafY family protein [Williamsia deligens]MCP2195206.1 proteasome accessory factor C [Williamsia deligens]